MLRRFRLLALALFALAIFSVLSFPEPASALSVSLSVNPSSITEEGGAQKVTVSATVTGIGSPYFCFYVGVGAHNANQQTATEGTDYADVSQKLVTFNFLSNATVTFNVTPTDDSVSDTGETIRVHSWEPNDQNCKSNITLSYGSINLTLNDSDPKANLSVSPAEINEDAGATEVTVTATLNLQGARTLGSSVTYTGKVGKTGDTATKDTDYTAGNFTVTMPSGTANAQATATFTLTPAEDNLTEGDETITVVGESTNDGNTGEATITLKNVASYCSSQSSDDLKADCAVLETLYDYTGGADWKTSTNWKSSSALDQWHGVTVSGGRVTEIDLSKNQLTGTIPTDINNLTGLVKLALWRNSLSGEIPNLSSLDSLRTLHLDGNNLSGEIPDPRELDHLWDINLSDNSLGGTITSIGLDSESSKPHWVRLSNNRVSGTIPDLSSNWRLERLHLDGNNLSGTLDALASESGRSTLGIVDLSRNNISGTIPDLSKLALGSLYVAHNKLSGTLDNLTKLGNRPYNKFWGLDLGGNNLSGTIPDLSFFTNSGRHLTRILSLYGNKLSGSLPDLSSFTGIRVIDLSDNDFTGTIGDLGGSSEDLSVLSALYVLDVSGNSLSGQIPVSSKLPGALEYFQLNDNNFTGSVPDLSGLTKLKALGLWGNPDLTLTGITLPSGITRSVIDWAALWTLHYKNNGYGWNSRSKWVGGSPMGEWHGVTTGTDGRVTVLNLRNNNLRGGISGSIAALGSMTTLNLSCNTSLSGELPLGLKDINTLTNVNICSTGMSAPSDQSFTDWKNGANVTFTDGTCSPACPAPVSQQSSPPPPVEEEVEEQGGSGQGEGSEDDGAKYDEEPVVASEDIEGGGCALVSEAGESKPVGAFGLLVAASVLTLAVSRRGRRQSGERRHSG